MHLHWPNLVMQVHKCLSNALATHETGYAGAKRRSKWICLGEAVDGPYSIFLRWKIHQAVNTIPAMTPSRTTQAQRQPSRGSFTFIP